MKTKKELLNYIRNIIYSHNLKDTISEDEKNWLITNVFKYHYKWQWFLDKGNISYISIGTADYGTRCFYLHFEDDTCTNISFNKCLMNMSKEDIKMIKPL